MELLLQFAIVGFGKAGRRLGNLLKSIPTASISHVIDLDLNTAEIGAQEVGAAAWGNNPSEVVRFSDIDAIVIATPNSSHDYLTQEALDFGKNVFLEAPLALRLPDALRIETKANQSGLVVAINFWTRASEGIQLIRGRIPRPTLIQIEAVVNPLVEAGPGEAKNGGVLAYNGSHAFDLACYLARSRPLYVQATGGRHTRRAALADTVAATIGFANGSLARVIVGEYGLSSTFSEWRIFATDGIVSATAKDDLHTGICNLHMEETPKPLASIVDPHQAHLESLLAYIQALTGRGDPLANIADGVRAVHLADSIYEAIASRERVVLS